ncbi:MAG: hypothetical protein KDA90_17755 [Planctomycetaceae bacterium]|nr:hypothetical protein [Planctomycetaceae bacterium]
MTHSTDIHYGTRTGVLVYPILTLVITLLGCGQPVGPERARVSGTAHYDGRPIPYGEIKFSPDAELGGNGPQGQVFIVDGKFDTAKLDKGPVAGPHVVEIYGFDGIANEEVGPWGDPLFIPYTTKVTVSSGDSILEFSIPAGQKPVKAAY